MGPRCSPAGTRGLGGGRARRGGGSPGLHPGLDPGESRGHAVAGEALALKRRGAFQGLRQSRPERVTADQGASRDPQRCRPPKRRGAARSLRGAPERTAAITRHNNHLAAVWLSSRRDRHRTAERPRPDMRGGQGASSMSSLRIKVSYLRHPEDSVDFEGIILPYVHFESIANSNRSFI